MRMWNSIRHCLDIQIIDGDTTKYIGTSIPLRSIIGIDLNILQAQIAGPDGGALFTQSEVDVKLDTRTLEDRRGVLLSTLCVEWLPGAD